MLLTKTEKRYLDVHSVAVIGAGVSGVATAIHLHRAGLNVTVFERNSRAGGVWVYDERVPIDAAYPSTSPSIGDSPDDEEDGDTQGLYVQGGPSRDDQEQSHRKLKHAPPGPAYAGLKNNVSTIEMEMQSHTWNPGTEEFVLHNILATYIQDAAHVNGIESIIHLNARVRKILKIGKKWRVETSKLVENSTRVSIEDSEQDFDAVVVATGHYHACNIPDIAGLATWKKQFPERIQHSKLYRRPESFRDQNVLLVGAGVSSTDIARELGPVAKSIYQVSRGGQYDLPPFMLPENAIRIGAIRSFDPCESEPNANGAISGTVTLRSGERLCDIHRVILCTGYHVSFPFMRRFHADGVRAEDANETVLVTDGQQTHNLHKDIFYIPDPTLSFIGVPYHIATFSFFEFQAMALAAVFAGWTPLPSEADMREQYRERLRAQGAGRTFHSLKDKGAEIRYVVDLVDMVNDDIRGGARMSGHSQRWHEAYERRVVRLEALFARRSDEPAAEGERKLVVSC